jgi:hypothetical protein
MAAVFVSCALAGYAGFKTIQNPGGGRIAYGPINGRTSTQSAMGQMLHDVQEEYGARPTLGKELHDEHGELLATFFNLTQKSDNHQVAGLIVVSVPKNGAAQAAVLSDDAKRFPRTLDEMLDRLQTVMETRELR